MTVTRNYGETASEKTNELIKHLLIATFSVILLIAFALGPRESIVVGVAVSYLFPPPRSEQLKGLVFQESRA